MKCAEAAVRSKLWLQMTCHLAHVCDNGASQQKVLLDRSRHEGACVFRNVFDRVPALAAFGIGGSTKAPYSTMKKEAQLAPVIHFGYCMAHCSEGDSVQCRVQPTDLDISGSPCNSWSREGLRMCHNSPWIAATLAWCAWLVAAQIPLAIHENVVGFDMSVLQEMIGHLYDLHPLQVQPSDVGIGWIRRSRLYVVCVLRSALVVSHDITQLYSQVCRAIGARSNGTIADLIRASKDELLVEENLVRQARKMALVPRPSKDWTYLLTSRQQTVLAKLSAEWLQRHQRKPIQDPECVFDLHRSLQQSSCPAVRGKLPTLTTTNVRSLWLPHKRRWLLHRELSAAMGYPVYRDLALAANVSEDKVTSPPGCISTTLGNAMHVANAGCVLAVALAATSPRK